MIREAQAIEAAPVSTAEALARLEAERAKVSARVAARRAERARAFFAPSGVSHVAGLGFAEGFGASPREIEHAIRDAVEERFLAEADEWRNAIKAHAVAGKPIASTERPALLTDLAQRRRALLQRAEQIVLSAERDGLDLDRPAELADVPDLVACVVLAGANA